MRKLSATVVVAGGVGFFLFSLRGRASETMGGNRSSSTQQLRTPTPRVTDATVPDLELGVRSRVRAISQIGSNLVRPDTLKPTGMIYGDSSHFARITAVLENDQTVIVTDSRTSPHVFIFDRRSGKLLRTMGRQGEGPGEIVYPDNIVRDERDPGVVWIYDFNQRRLVGLDVSGKKSERALNVSLPAGGSLLQPMRKDGRVISNGLFPDYSLLFLDGNGRPIGKSDLMLPYRSPEVESRVARRLLNVSTMAFSPRSRDKIVLAYQFKSELDILDLATGIHTTVVGPRSVKASFHFGQKGAFVWNADNQSAYVAVTADETRIYALFSGHKDNDQSAHSALLHVFDWKGTFVAEHAFDRLVTTIAASASGNELYAGVEEPWPAIIKYRLPASGSRQ